MTTLPTTTADFVPAPVRVTGSGTLNDEPEPWRCTCARNGASGLEELEDIMLAGFSQVEACWLLWVADRDQITARFPHVTASPADVPQKRRGRTQGPRSTTRV